MQVYTLNTRKTHIPTIHTDTCSISCLPACLRQWMTLRIVVDSGHTQTEWWQIDSWKIVAMFLFSFVQYTSHVLIVAHTTTCSAVLFDMLWYVPPTFVSLLRCVYILWRRYFQVQFCYKFCRLCFYCLLPTIWLMRGKVRKKKINLSFFWLSIFSNKGQRLCHPFWAFRHDINIVAHKFKIINSKKKICETLLLLLHLADHYFVFFSSSLLCV